MAISATSTASPAGDAQSNLDSNHQPWNWWWYHATLLYLANVLPPLMRTMQNERANHVNWLATERFPLPLFRLVRHGDASAQVRSLAEAPVTLDEQHPLLTIETRCGTVAHILRSSLVAALAWTNAERRRAFFGCTFVEPEPARIAYVSWRALVGGPDDPELPPQSSGDPESIESTEQRARIIRTPSLWDLMEQSLSFVGGNVCREPESERVIDHDVLHYIGLGEDRAPTAPQPPTLLIVDAIGAPLSYHRAIIAIARELADAARAHDALARPSEAPRSKNWTNTIVLSTAGHIPHGNLTCASQHTDLEDIVFADAPTTPIERRAFMEAWERWRSPHIRPRVAAREAKQLLAQVDASLTALDMARVETPESRVTYTPDDRADIASFDIECAISAILRDDMPCASPSQLWRGLSERLRPEEKRAARRALIAFFQERSLLAQAPRLDAEDFVNAYMLLPDRPLMRFGDLSPSEVISAIHALDNQDTEDLSRSCGKLLADLRSNPLLASLIFPLVDAQFNPVAFQLLNEPLAMAIIAHDTVAELEKSDDTKVYANFISIALLMSVPTWTHFIEAVFELLDERIVPGLPRHLLEQTAGYLLAWSVSDGKNVRATYVDLIADAYAGITGKRQSPRDISKAASRIAELNIDDYIDALVRASLHHTVQMGGTVPGTWLRWVGYGLSEDERAGLSITYPLPGIDVVAEHVAYLRSLLDEPIPACDNALRVLRACGLA